jgi:hypothetical protein
MNRYYLHDGPSSFRFELIGVVSGAAARQIEQTWQTASSVIQGKLLVIDLSLATGIDEAVSALLTKWCHGGAQLVSKSHKGRLLAESILGNSPRWSASLS